jgi:RNA polymerase sigma factor (sigma-70 family)
MMVTPGKEDKTSIGLYFKDVDDGPLLTREQEVSLAKYMDASRWRHPANPKNSAYAQNEEEKNDPNKIIFNPKKIGQVSFTKIWRDNVNPAVLRKSIRSREKMITANLRLVAKIAKKYQNRGCDFEDLIQEGNLGLIRGIDGYDYTKTHTDENGRTSNIKLSTYCTAWIHQRINRLIQNHSRTVRIPVHVQTLAAKLQRLADDFVSDRGTEPTVSQLLDLVNKALSGKQASKTRDAVSQALASPYMHTVSLDKPNQWTENADTLHNCIPDSSNENFENTIFRQEMIKAVRETIMKLTPREEKIARLRFGITEDPLRHDLNPISKQEIEILKHNKKSSSKR